MNLQRAATAREMRRSTIHMDYLVTKECSYSVKALVGPTSALLKSARNTRCSPLGATLRLLWGIQTSSKSYLAACALGTADAHSYSAQYCMQL